MENKPVIIGAGSLGKAIAKICNENKTDVIIVDDIKSSPIDMHFDLYNTPEAKQFFKMMKEKEESLGIHPLATLKNYE